jgi:hypothetical protein
MLALPLGLLSQSRALQRADNFYNRFNYTKALRHYLKAEEKGEARHYVTRRIADCYRLLNMPVNSVEWYEKAINFPDVEAETYYHLGHALRTLKRYEESEGYLLRFQTLTRTQPNRRGLSPEDYLHSMLADSGRVEVYTMNINSAFSEYGPALWQDKLVFSSNRPGKSVIRHKDARNDEPFVDLYATTVSNLTKTSYPTIFEPKLKTSLNDGPVSFSSDGTMMYITRNTRRNPEGISELDILIGRFREGKWGRSLATMPLKMKGYSIAHPAISHDDQRLYFASDMPGGYGGMDLYYSERRGGFFSPPVNLGPHINTPGNEIFPYVDKEGRLFFASDGHDGLGGLDIFISLPTPSGGLSEPFNPGPGINSPYDDFSIVLNEDGTTGYFASNRPGGVGNDDIYAFRMVRPYEFIPLTGTITNLSSGEPEPGVIVSVSKNDGSLFATFQSDEKGNYLIHLLKDETYKIVFRKRLMEPQEKTISPVEMQSYSTINLNVEMSPR